MGSFFVTVGKIAYRFATRAAAQAFAKSRSGASNITKSAPKGLPVRKGPKPTSSVNQPRSADTGKMQSPKPSPAIRAETRPSSASPKKPSTPARADKKPTSVGSTKSSSTDVATTSAKKTTGGRGKPPLMPKSMVKSRTNTGAPKASSRPAALRSSLLDLDGERKSPSTTPNNKSGEMPKTKKANTTPTNKAGEMPTPNKSTAKSPSKSTKSKTTTRPKMNPLDGWSDARRKTLRSDKIGTDAGDGMKWVVGSNSNALVRTRDMDRVKENLRLQKLVKQTKAKETKRDPNETAR